MKKNTIWLIANGIGALGLIGMMATAVFSNFNPDTMEGLVGTSGDLTIWWLLFTMAITPLNSLFGWRKLLTVRKAAGLYAFAFGVLHLIFYAGEHDFGLNATWTAVLDEPRLWMGLLAFVIMVPLALTSNRFSMRGLGKNWKRLHRLTYIIGVLAIIHIALFGEGFIYLPILTTLLILRVPRVRRQTVAWRKRWQSHKSAVVSG